MTCGDCFYNENLICVRYPPIPVGIGTNLTSMFPIISNRRWCGEWKQDEVKRVNDIPPVSESFEGIEGGD